jgi:hypothetical protein
MDRVVAVEQGDRHEQQEKGAATDRATHQVYDHSRCGAAGHIDSAGAAHEERAARAPALRL